jgi:hypothetical protein
MKGFDRKAIPFFFIVLKYNKTQYTLDEHVILRKKQTLVTSKITITNGIVIS